MGSKINIINTSGKRLQKKPGINQTNISSDGKSLEIKSPLFDGNAGGGGSGTPGGNDTQIQFNDNGSFGGSTGFTFDKTNLSINLGYCTNIFCNSYRSSIIGGELSNINNSQGSIIIGGSGYQGTPDEGETGGNRIYGGQNNLISGGFYLNDKNTITNNINKIYFSCSSSILGGENNFIDNSKNSFIIGGESNKLSICCSKQYNSSIIGGKNNCLSFSDNSSIVGGQYNTLSCYSSFSSIVGGSENILSDCSNQSSIVGGFCNILSDCSNQSSIVGGFCNILSDCSNQSSIVGGSINVMSGCSYQSSIVGGNDNKLFSSGESSILGGQNNILSSSTRSAIIGGQSLNLIGEVDTVLLPNLKVNNSISSLSGGTFYSGITGEYVVGANTFTIVNGIITNLV
jgi:hypothetical protein